MVDSSLVLLFFFVICACRCAGSRRRDGILEGWLVRVECHHHIQQLLQLLQRLLVYKKEQEGQHLPLPSCWHALYVLFIQVFLILLYWCAFPGSNAYLRDVIENHGRKPFMYSFTYFLCLAHENLIILAHIFIFIFKRRWVLVQQSHVCLFVILLNPFWYLAWKRKSFILCYLSWEHYLLRFVAVFHFLWVWQRIVDSYEKFVCPWWTLSTCPNIVWFLWNRTASDTWETYVSIGLGRHESHSMSLTDKFWVMKWKQYILYLTIPFL